MPLDSQDYLLFQHLVLLQRVASLPPILESQGLGSRGFPSGHNKETVLHKTVWD